MLEKDFQTQVIKYLKEKGCYVLNVPGGSSVPKGTPDLLVCVNGKFWGIELKTDKGVVSQLQLHNLAKIKEAGGQAFVLRPEGFDMFKLHLEHEVNR